ncbi:MAG: kelch repeat-containing protein [Planctomycetota bacterium]
MVRHNKLVWVVLLMLVASFGFGGFGQGGGCMGTQSQVRMVGGSSGQFLLLSPNNGGTTGVQPTFIWTAFPVDLTSYTLQIFTQSAYPTGTPAYQNTNINPRATAFQIGATTLQQNTTYYWRVIAVDSDTGTSTTASNAPFSFNVGITPGQFTLLSPIPPSETIYTTTPTLIWSESAQATSYNVQIDTENSFNDPLIYQVDLPVTTTYQVPSGRLTNGVTYYWRVRAINSTNPSGPTTASNAPASFYVVGAPGSFLLSAPAISSTQQTITPTLSWTGSTQAITYRVEIALNAAYTPTVLSYSGITDTSFSVPAGVLQNGYTYYWIATAINSVGEISATNTNPPFSFAVDISPQQFTQSSPISASVISTLTPIFSWSTSNLATEYTLEISTSAAFPPTPMIFPTISSTTYTLPAGRLNDNQTYWWRVIANNITGVTRTASNAPLSFRTNVAPRAFTLNTPISGTTIDTMTPTFTWTISDLATEYTLQIATDLGFTSPATLLGITTTAYTISGGLVNGQEYWWRVIAISNDTPITTAAANAPYRFLVNVGPLNFTLSTPVTGTTFTTVTPTFTWSISGRATSYVLQITSTGTSSLVYENVNIVTTSFNLPSGVLSSGQSYLWSVSAANDFTTDATRVLAGNAPLIFSVNVTPAGFSLSTPISGSIMGSLTPTLEWGPSNLATTYYLQIDDDSTFIEPYRYENRGITTTSFTVPSNALTMGTTYWWRITAVNAYGQRMATNAPYSFTPTTAPSNFILVSPNTDSIVQDSLAPTFTWTSSVYATTYTLQISAPNQPSFATLAYENSAITSTTESFRIPDGLLETARTYYWRVIASNDQGQGQTYASNGPFNFTTQVYPTAFTLSQPQNGAIIYTLTPMFTWSLSTIQTGYTLQVDNEATFSPPLVYENTAIPSTSNAATIPGGTLTGNTLYYWRVIARNASGTTIATGAPSQFTAGAAPGAFELITPISGTVEVALTPTLTWLVSANSDGYTVEIDDEPTFTSPIVYRVPGIISDTYDVPLNVLSSRRTYYWRVIAGNEFGVTTATNTAPYAAVFYSVFDTFIPGTAPDPFNITSPVNGSILASYTPVLSWNDSVGETGYTIEVATSTDFSAGLLIYTTTGTNIARNTTAFTLTIDALPDVGTYYWRVIASNSFGSRTANNAPFAMIVDPTTSPWKPISTESFNMFDERRGHTAVWTGSEMLIWGGFVTSGTETTYFGDGVRYNPTLGAWDYINDIGAPATRTGHTAVWTGTEMIIWGGRNSSTNFFNDGARYDPVNDTWTPLLDSGNAPTARSNHIAVWSP